MMSPFRAGVRCLTTVLVLLCAASPASANGFWHTLARGLQFAGWNPSSGGDIGVVRHILGDGWSVQSYKLLNAYEINTGLVNLELGSATGGPVYLNTDAEIYTRFGPYAKLRIATENATKGGTQVPANYKLTVNTGIENLTLQGTGSLLAEANINALGFYNVQAFISNRGNVTIDGPLSTARDLNFDLGPVSLQGNLFVDSLAQVTDPLFASAGVTNPFSVLSGRAKLQTKLKERDEMLARLEAGQTLSDEEMAEILNTSLLESLYGGAGSDALALLGDQLKAGILGEGKGPSATGTSVVPEPLSSACWLVLVPAAGLVRRSCRRA